MFPIENAVAAVNELADMATVIIATSRHPLTNIWTIDWSKR